MLYVTLALDYGVIYSTIKGDFRTAEMCLHMAVILCATMLVGFIVKLVYEKKHSLG